MTVTVLAMVTFAENQGAALSHYLEVTTPLLKRANAIVTKMFDLNEAVVGHRPAKRMIIVEYPNRAAVDVVFNCDEYKALIPTRDIAFTSYDISIAEQLAELPLVSQKPTFAASQSIGKEGSLGDIGS